MSKDIRQSKRFSELEYCLQKYFDTYVTPAMREVESDLQKRQAEETEAFSLSPAGLLRSFTNGMTGAPDDTAQYLRLTGEWNGKMAEDYVEMCRKRIAGDAGHKADLALLAGEWRNAVVAEIGRERYDSLSGQLGGDLAFAYVDYRMEQLMIERMVADRMPRSSVEYVLRKGMEGSLFGLTRSLTESPLEQAVGSRCEAAYRPSAKEKAAGKALSFAVDTAGTGGIASWTALAGTLGLEAASFGVEWYLEGKEKAGKPVPTVEDCISRGVFGRKDNVFAGFRRQSKTVVPYENEYVQSVNKRLVRPMGIPTEKPVWEEMMEKRQMPLKYEVPDSNRKDGRYKDVPMIIAPGCEEEYLRQEAELAESRKKEAEAGNKEENRRSDEAQEQASQTEPEAEPAQSDERQPTNENGWAGLLQSLGLDGMEHIGKNLGYVVSMLPDVLVGLFTGKTKSFGIKDSLLPLASILLGMSVRNPLLKLVLIGTGGLNLLNKAGKEALDRQETAPARLYRTYPDEPLNPRLAGPVLQGDSLFMDIDGVPCSVQLSHTASDACSKGALPLNTLANAVLAKYDETRLLAQENYRMSERSLEEGKEQSLSLK